jgi:serine/threonine-protein kinase
VIDGWPYLIMELIAGETLAAWMSRAGDRGGLGEILALLDQIAAGLAAIHAAGIVHRDLKLDNVFLTDNSDDPATPRVKLLDWGIAKIIHHDVKHTIEGQLMGTPQYLSPEQARGQAVSPQTDVYSLGVMAYELFLEQLPFEAETAAEVMAMHLRNTPPPPRELWPDVPPELEALLIAMLAKQADQRPTATEVAERLELVRGELEQRCLVRGGARLASPQPRRTPSRPPVRAASRPPARAASRPPARAASRPGSKPGRVISSPGLAPTQLFGWRSETRRWQYALGGLALAISGLMFWISRVGDRAASAATVPQLVAAPPETGAAATPEPQRAAAEPMLEGAAPIGPTADDDSADVVLRPAVLTERDTAPAALREARNDRLPVVAPRGGAQRAGSRPAPARSSPAAPRLRAKLDPDGTLDVYR